MSHIVWIDRTTHREVVADYTGSPRHKALTLADWQAEYSNDAAYSDMRDSFPTAVADVVADVSPGLWKNDWSAPYVAPYEKLEISSDAAAEFDGVQAVDANGTAKHNVTIKKVDEQGADVTTGSEPIRVFVSAACTVSNMSPNLASGTVTIEVGPQSSPFDVVIEAKDPAGAIKSATPLKIRFK